jgi:hypothetical protein
VRPTTLTLVLAATLLIPVLGCRGENVAKNAPARAPAAVTPAAADAAATQAGAPRHATGTPIPPDANAHRLGTQVVLGDLAVTVNGAGTGAGRDAPVLDPGKIFFQVHVTMENVGQGAVTVYPDRFSLVDTSGTVYDALLNKPSAWDAVRDMLLDVTTLEPGDELQQQLLLVVVDEAAAPRLMVRYTVLHGPTATWKTSF